MPGHLERIRIFLTVAERKSFAGAAGGLQLSASSITRAVAELEADLGVQLFTRTTRRVALTEAGQRYRQQILSPLAQIDQADDEARGSQTTLKGRLRISAPLSFGQRYLAGPLARFRQDHPEIDLSLDLTDRFVDIQDDDLDMALRISGTPTDLSTIWRKIAPIPRRLVAAPAYLAREGRPESPADLSGHACLSYSGSPAGETWQLTEAASGTTHPVHAGTGFRCNNGDLLADMAAAGCGIVLLPDFLLRTKLDRGDLVPVLPDWQPPEIWLTAFYPPYRKLPAAVARFTETVEAAMADAAF